MPAKRACGEQRGGIAARPRKARRAGHDQEAKTAGARVADPLAPAAGQQAEQRADQRDERDRRAGGGERQAEIVLQGRHQRRHDPELGGREDADCVEQAGCAATMSSCRRGRNVPERSPRIKYSSVADRRDEPRQRAVARAAAVPTTGFRDRWARPDRRWRRSRTEALPRGRRTIRCRRAGSRRGGSPRWRSPRARYRASGPRRPSIRQSVAARPQAGAG